MNILISVALLAFAGIFKEGDAITEWTTPSVTGATGTADPGFTFAEDTTTGTGGVAKQMVATGGTAPVTYTLQTSGTPFSIASDGTLSLDTALDFETTQSYTIAIHGEDSADPVVTGVATVTITVTDVNEATPVFATTYSPCIVDGSTQDTTLTTVAATDADTANTITYSITGGNTDTAFKIDGSSGVIQVETGKTLDKTTTATYNLEVKAADDGSSPAIKTVTTIVSVTVADSCSSGSVAVAFSIVTLFVALSATLI